MASIAIPKGKASMTHERRKGVMQISLLVVVI
jgi:hypothetical protein